MNLSALALRSSSLLVVVGEVGHGLQASCVPSRYSGRVSETTTAPHPPPPRDRPGGDARRAAAFRIDTDGGDHDRFAHYAARTTSPAPTSPAKRSPRCAGRSGCPPRPDPLPDLPHLRRAQGRRLDPLNVGLDRSPGERRQRVGELVQHVGGVRRPAGTRCRGRGRRRRSASACSTTVDVAVAPSRQVRRGRDLGRVAPRSAQCARSTSRLRRELLDRTAGVVPVLREARHRAAACAFARCRRCRSAGAALDRLRVAVRVGELDVAAVEGRSCSLVSRPMIASQRLVERVEALGEGGVRSMP